MRLRFASLAVALAAAALLAARPAGADDRHAGYYYPPPDGPPEVYEARAEVLQEANRFSRIGFVTGIATENRKRPYPPVAVMFAKGEEAQKLIIVALQDGRIDTIYRARAIFADMTSVARLLPIFREMGVEDYFTFFDLCRMLGFEQITISNGRDFSHQILLQ